MSRRSQTFPYVIIDSDTEMSDNCWKVFPYICRPSDSIQTDLRLFLCELQEE